MFVYRVPERLQQDKKIIEITGSHEKAQDAAMLYSLFATCHLHNINPLRNGLPTCLKILITLQKKTYTYCYPKTILLPSDNNDGVR